MTYSFSRALVAQSLFAFSLTAVASAASAADAAKDNTLSPVIVTATRTATPAEQIASSVTVITAEEIEQKQRRTLPDILQDVPGLNVVQAGGPGSATSIFIRGTNANHTKVILDGVDINDPTSPNNAFDYSQILASDIERIEVLRGPQGGLYGSDAIGGVINIITKQGFGPARATASLEAGSFSTFNQTAGIKGATDKVNYAFNAGHYRSNDVQVTPSNLVVPGRHLRDDGYDNRTYSTKLGANLTDNFDVGFVGRYIDTQLNSTLDDGTGPEDLRSESKNRIYTTRGTAHLALFDGKLDQTAGVGYTDYRRRILDPNAGTFAPETHYNGERIKYDWQGDIKLIQGQTVTLAAEHQNDTVDSFPTKAEVNNNAASIQLQSAFGEQLFNTISLRRDDHDRFGGKTTYRVAPAFLIKETGTKFKASYGTGFKAPSLEQLYHDYPAFGFTANPNLKPETSKGYDIGFEQNILDKQVQFGSTYFHNEIKDLIDYNTFFTTLINVKDAETYGFENFIAYKPWNALSLRADHTFTVAENSITNTSLSRRPKHKVSLNATWQATDKLSLTGTAQYSGSWIDVNRSGTAQGLRPGGYTTVNLTANYELEKQVALYARIDNALDKQYQTPIGYQRPGLAVYGGVRFTFDDIASGAPTK